jgi:hypothetical protein
VLAVGAILIAVVLVVIALTGGDDGAESETSGEVILEPVSSTGDNPFMASVGTDLADVTPPAAAASASGVQSYTGGTPGLYGGTQDNASCNAAQMVTFLETNPAKAEVWAETLGIATSEIRSYVAGLTSVVLRADTRVTNHGFANGRATEIPAVLQAGTAVLVDKYGTPVVKCFCGNPLTPPKRYAEPTYVGARWPTFRPTGVTVIVKNTVVINTFTLVDPRTGQAFGRPAGGGPDGPAPSTSSSTTTTTRRGGRDASIDGRYIGEIPEACGFGTIPVTIDVQRTGSSIALTFIGEGAEAATIPIAADLSFSGSGTATDGQPYTLTGRFDETTGGTRISGTISDAECTATFNGERVG